MVSAILVMLVIGALLGLVLGLASRAFHVEVDNRIEDVTGMLPGLNCGACGYPGCAAFAEALVNGEVDSVARCLPSKAEQREAIAEYLNTHPGSESVAITVKAV